jgi:hypothetical protein
MAEEVRPDRHLPQEAVSDAAPDHRRQHPGRVNLWGRTRSDHPRPPGLERSKPEGPAHPGTARSGRGMDRDSGFQGLREAQGRG